MLFQKYLKSTKFVKNAASEEEMQKFQQMVEFFKKYSGQYDMDYLLMAAQGYQESQLDQNAKSQVGAVGVMQVMPATGKDLKVGDISQLEPNIHAGVKYMRFMIDQYFANEPMDKLNKGLFAFASYNAGPGRIQSLRKEAAKRGLDPNMWFNNVEVVASEKIGRETVTYVATSTSTTSPTRSSRKTSRSGARSGKRSRSPGSRAGSMRRRSLRHVARGSHDRGPRRPGVVRPGRSVVDPVVRRIRACARGGSGGLRRHHGRAALHRKVADRLRAEIPKMGLENLGQESDA